MVGLYVTLPFKKEERNYGIGEEEIILLFWKLPNTTWDQVHGIQSVSGQKLEQEYV